MEKIGKRKIMTYVLPVFLLVGFFFSLNLLSGSEVYACCPSGTKVCKRDCPYGQCGECGCIHYGTWNCINCGNYDCCPICTTKDCTCTVTCPSGYRKTPTGPYCPGITRSSSCDMGCGKTKTCTAKCYPLDKNIAPSKPTSVVMTIDGESFTLSTDSSNPKVVKYPSGPNSNVRLSLPKISTPSTSRGVGYIFGAKDFNTESTNETVSFLPTSGILNVLREGSQGQVDGSYYTLNQCDDNRKVSEVLNTYYKVNNIPEPEEVCEWDPSLAPDDPECKEPDDDDQDDDDQDDDDSDDDDSDDDTDDDDNGGGGDSSVDPFRGCKAEKYTGRDVNNPLKIRLAAKDKDGNGEIRGAIAWFSKSGTTPNFSSIGTNYDKGTNENEIGIMIFKDGNTWDNPKVYAINNSNLSSGDNTATWVGIGDKTVKNSLEEGIVKVTNIKVSANQEKVIFELELEFLTNSSGKQADGVYDFKGIVLDKHMILSDQRVDQAHMKTFFKWGIDLNDPVIETIKQVVLGPQRLSLDLVIDGTSSFITDLVINGYKDSGKELQEILLEKPTGYNPINPMDTIPSIDLIGHLTGQYSGNSWHIPSINKLIYSSDGNVIVNIGGNEEGSIVLYVTAFDQACNASIKGTTIDLRPWIATRGGVVYSQGSLGPEAKDLGEEASSYYKISNEQTTLKNYSLGQVLNELTTGTELVSSRNVAIKKLLYSDALEAVMANYIYDSNETKQYWFDHFKEKLEQRLLSQSFVDTLYQNSPSTDSLSLVGKVSSYCGEKENCLFYSVDNITVGSGFKCDKKTLVMSEKDIIINPDVEAPIGSYGIEGCIFLAKNKIIVKEGQYKSTNKVGYDYIDGFLMAMDQVVIEEADTGENIEIRDGLEVRGGIIGMGRDSFNDPSVLQKRKLRLFSYFNPTLVIVWDVRYAKLSEIFFGAEAAMYKQEVGFKAY